MIFQYFFSINQYFLVASNDHLPKSLTFRESDTHARMSYVYITIGAMLFGASILILLIAQLSNPESLKDMLTSIETVTTTKKSNAKVRMSKKSKPIFSSYLILKCYIFCVHFAGFMVSMKSRFSFNFEKHIIIIYNEGKKNDKFDFALIS